MALIPRPRRNAFSGRSPEDIAAGSAAAAAKAQRQLTTTRTATADRETIVATICLYGTHEHGVGWLATIESGNLRGTSMGNGELCKGMTFTEATWAACETFRDLGIKAGKAWVNEPSGRLRATVDISSPCYFGDLKWEPAEVLTISYEDLMAEAERQKAAGVV